ncbi:MAG: Ldh family oxidoreductase [Enhygromyxa sp.]
MRVIHPRDAERLAKAAARARGLADEHAELLARALVSTSLRGVDSHGLRLLPLYLRELEEGRANPRPRWTWTSPRPALTVLDADAAPGVVAGLVAATRAAELARAQGLGLVSVVNSNHFGAASVYTLELARHGLLGLCCSNADPLMAAPGARVATLGTNPLSIAMPTSGEPFCLDMATSQVAWGRVKATWAAAGRLPPGWARDADGRDCAEPGAGPPVLAQTLGGSKGAGLALAVELLCAGLVGAGFGNQQSHLFAAPWDRPREVVHTLIAIDIAAFGEPEPLLARVSDYLGWYRAQPRVDGQPGIVPGDLEAQAEQERADELEIEDAVAEALGI